MTYAIGDIHGCNRSFEALLATLLLRDGDRLVLLGDYIDRGPDSRGVVDTIFRMREAGFEVVCRRGNHEQLLLDGLLDPVRDDIWRINGGQQALDSFGVAASHEIPEKYLHFFESTLFWYEMPGYLFVHGGLDFSLPDPLAQPEHMMWMRRWYAGIDYGWLGQRIVLHGHTPEDAETIREQHARLNEQQYLNLDNGCVYAYLGRSGDRRLGNLVGFCLESKEMFWQPCLE